MTTRIGSVSSRDGVPLTYETFGDGPPVVLVLGAFNTRATGVGLAAALAPSHTVYTYDRRGRGDSGDADVYAVERELDDLDALIAVAGAGAAVVGYSSGAALTLTAAARGASITHLALYDLPLMLSPRPGFSEHPAALAALVRDGRRGDAVEYFQRRIVGIPDAVVAQLRGAPFRPALEAMAHTLVYETTILGDGALSRSLASAVHTPTLALVGAASPPFMRETAEALARAAPAARAVVLDGAGHDLGGIL